MTDAVRAVISRADEAPSCLHAMVVTFDPSREVITILLNTGFEVGVVPAILPDLACVPTAVLADVTLSPAGLALRFPGRPDVPLSAVLAGLLGGRTWMSSLMGRYH